MSQRYHKIAVIGAGSWGTALSMVLASKYNSVSLWGHNVLHIEDLRNDRENKKYLPGFSLPANVLPESDLQRAVKDCQIICMVVPSHGFRDVYSRIVREISGDCCVVSAVKGIENDTFMTMSEVIKDENAKQQSQFRISSGIITGPSFAREVAQRMPTAVTAGASDIDTAKAIQNCFVTDSFRVYASTDMIGLEISSALKNIIAIGAGICDGLGYGHNTRAALITRGLTELTRFGVAMGAEKETFYGLSGIGDLLLTCTGDLSRNRSVGIELGKGKKLEDIIKEMNMVAEGVKTTRSVYGLAQKKGIEMPILEQVYAILYEDKACEEAVEDLLKRELKNE